MTLIANPNKYKSKKAFREAIYENPTEVYVEAPGLHPASMDGSIAEVMKEHDSITVTNHPKRSWFAQVKIAPKGKYKGQIRVI